MGTNWDLSADVVIVGSGIGGMTAAIVAHDEGLKPMVLEKSAHYVGGSSARSGGAIWIPNNKLQVRAGIEDSESDAFEYTKVSTRNQIPDDVLMSFIKTAPIALDYLLSHTKLDVSLVKNYPDYYQDAKGSREGGRILESLPFNASILGEDFRHLNPTHPQVRVFDRLMVTNTEAEKLLEPGLRQLILMTRLLCKYLTRAGERRVYQRDTRLTMGNALMGSLFYSVLERQIPILRNARVVELVLEENEVTGVEAKIDGKLVRIQSKMSTVLASGGFERNREMRETYQQAPITNEWTTGNIENVGDGISIGMKVGAQTDLMHEALWTPVARVPGEQDNYIILVEKNLPGSIIVNRQGKRYFNEAMYYKDAVSEMYKEHGKSGGGIPSYLVFDGKFRRKYICGPLLPGYVMPDFLARKYFKSGFVKKANSIEMLAEKIGIDGETLKKTIQKFNGCAHNNDDVEFGRGKDLIDRFYGDSSVSPNPCLAPLDKAPYYAIEVWPGDLGTFGGLSVDANAQVLDRKGVPIKGLLATGNCSAIGMIGSLSSSLTFGYIAVRTAIRNRESGSLPVGEPQASPSFAFLG